MKQLLLLLFGVSLLITSCGEKMDELKQVAEVVKNLPEASEKMEETANKTEERLKQRRAKGDTLAMHFSELLKYLPQTIDGFKAEEPEGSTTNSMGFSFTQVSNHFTKATSEGEQSIKVELIDYNAGYSYLSGLAYWANLNISTENTDGFERTVKTDIPDVYAYEKYSKSAKNASITYVIGYRFLLSINGDGVSGIEPLKDVANKMDLKKLAAF